MAEKNSHNPIEVFQTANDALVRIKQLRSEGIEEPDIHVFSDKQEHADKLTKETEVTFTFTEGSITEKVTSFFSGDSSEEKAIDRFIRLNEDEKEQYAKDLKDGKVILYVDVPA